MYHKNQSGAALVVALILLVALSLMAISSMNTATLDLIMAGNEQYRARSFVAAETGIQHAFADNHFDTSTDFTQVATATGLGNDTYGYIITRPTNGATTPAPAGNSAGTFGTVYFRISSTGTSERGTTGTHVQEFYQVVAESDSLTRDSSCGTANLDSSISTC